MYINNKQTDASTKTVVKIYLLNSGYKNKEGTMPAADEKLIAIYLL